MPLFCAPGPVNLMDEKDRKSSVSKIRDDTCVPSKAV